MEILVNMLLYETSERLFHEVWFWLIYCVLLWVVWLLFLKADLLLNKNK